MRVYIAGPMRGHYLYNFPAFDAAKDSLVDAGYDVVSPADLDRDSGFEPTLLPEDHDWNSWPNHFPSIKEIIMIDVKALLTCDAIYMLDGWFGSKGATGELAIAEWAGLGVMNESDA